MKKPNIEVPQVPKAESTEGDLDQAGAISPAEFSRMGFDNENTLTLLNGIPGISVQKVEDRLSFLRSHGFKYVDRIAEDYPWQIFRSREEDIEDAIDTLRTEIGVEDPVTTLSRQPQLIFVNKEKVKRRFSFLGELGFENPTKMVERNPGILGYTSESLVSKVGFLKDAGMPEPLKIVEVAPEILGMDKDSLQKKIKSLKKLFPRLDLPELIIKFKKVLTYSPEKLAESKALVDRVIELYDVPFDTDELVSYFPQILGYSTDRMILVARILKQCEVPGNDLKKSIVKLITKDLDSVMVALVENQKLGNSDINDLLKKIDEVKKMGFTKAEKQELVEDESLDKKIKLKYEKLSMK